MQKEWKFLDPCTNPDQLDRARFGDKNYNTVYDEVKAFEKAIDMEYWFTI